MSPLSRGAILQFILFAGLLLGGVVLQHRMIEDFKKQPPQFRDALYLPSSEYVRAVTMGYDHFAADFLFLRMIQTYAAGYSRPGNAERMSTYSDIITDLDPRFIEAYGFSVLALGESPEVAKEVFHVVDKAILNNPMDYALPKDGAYFSNWTLSDRERAKYYAAMAMMDPLAPVYLTTWIVYFETEGGRYRVAYEKILSDVVRIASGENLEYYHVRQKKMIEVGNLWIYREIADRAAQWKERYGFYPTVEELDASGAFKGIMYPDWARVFAVLVSLVENDKDTPWSDEEAQRFATEAVVPWDRLPQGPHDVFADTLLPPELHGFLIWPSANPQGDQFVLSRLEALRSIKGELQQLQAGAEKYRLENEGLCPLSFQDFAPAYEESADPFGGRWVWDPVQCRASVSSLPEIDRIELPNL